jgi:hypothetical protein
MSIVRIPPSEPVLKRPTVEAYVSYPDESDPSLCDGKHEWGRRCEGRAFLFMTCLKCGAKYSYDASD